jgi:hypothetical protein
MVSRMSLHYQTESQSAGQSRLPQVQLALPLDCSLSGKLSPRSSERRSAKVRPSFDRLGPCDEHSGAMWRRIVDEGVRFGRVNSQLGSEVGRLLFHGRITDVEAAAASQVADIYSRYERSQGLRRTPASPSYVNGIDHSDFDEENSDDVLRARRAKRHFHKLQMAIPTPRARTVLEQLCVDDRPIGPIDLMDLRKLLRQLAVMFRIANQ